jgi:predicted nucleic acid-binding protein
LECANVLVGAQRRGRLDGEQKKVLIERAMALPLLIDREAVSIGEIEWLAEQYGLTAYDAAYLELAIRRSLTLLTLDAKLVAAARAAHHPVETGLSG